MDFSMAGSSSNVFLHRLGESGETAAPYFELSALDFVLVLEQSPRRRTRGVRSVLIERAAVTRAHEQPRFLKPSDRAAQMGAVDGENLEGFRIDPAYPAGDFGGVAVPRLAVWVAIDGYLSFALGKLF